MKFDLDAFVRRALSTNEPDVHVLARRWFAKVPQEGRDELALIGLAYKLRQANSLRASSPASTSAVVSHRRAGPSFAEKYAHVQKRFTVAGTPRFYGDLSPADCEWLAGDYARRVAQNAAMESHFRGLAGRMRAAGVERVADLDVLPESLAA